jgi:fumarate hydratase class II
MNTRVETDSMGRMEVPDSAYYGAQTARALQNGPVSGWSFPRPFLRALCLIKKCAAEVNGESGRLKPEMAAAIAEAAGEAASGKWDQHFVLDVFQTGSGTSTNMNANEVIANRATELMGGARGTKLIHPNDHVNLGQSSNDVIPSALHVAAVVGLEERLIPALLELEETLRAKASEFLPVLKIGRTHLQDATPIRLGQEFSGYAQQMAYAADRVREALPRLRELALGGTAVGTGLNTPREFAEQVIDKLSRETGLQFREACNHFEAQASRDAAVEASGALKTAAVSLMKIANDIRLLGSGPRLGLGELRLPATQPGSSIMPGKVNPVLCEIAVQAGAQIIGQDAAITMGGCWGQLDLNTMIPVITHNLLRSIEILSNTCLLFARRCVAGLEANSERCAHNIEQSLSMVTVLAPVIGYDKAARIAKHASESGRPVRAVALEESGLSPAMLAELLNPESQV